MKRRAITFAIVTVLVCLVFIGSGIANVLHVPHVARDMTHLGYPTYFSTILGIWKIFGALAVAAPALPRVKEWAYAGMMFDLTGAAISRGVLGDGVAGVVPPLIVAGLVLASWRLRPEGRVLRPG
jgi:uncharacterized membrane protein YphA (DoxX/SURF4 family)